MLSMARLERILGIDEDRKVSDKEFIWAELTEIRPRTDINVNDFLNASLVSATARHVRSETFGKEPPVSQGFKENSLIYLLIVSSLIFWRLQECNYLMRCTFIVSSSKAPLVNSRIPLFLPCGS